MMIRDRSLRAFSLLVLVAGSASLVAAAGAGFTGTPAHHASAVASNAHATHSVAPSRTTSNDAIAHPAPKRATATVEKLSLPHFIPATMLPTGAHLPAPTPPPTDPYAPRQPTQLGRIVIPAIGLDQPFFEGVDQAAFAHGVGHWPGSAAPGGWGNAVFGGHRVTQTHPFLDTDKLVAGDEINFLMTNGWSYVYRVTRVYVVPQTATWIVDQKPGRTLTMFTCNPKGSSTQRLVTNGVLLRIVAPT